MIKKNYIFPHEIINPSIFKSVVDKDPKQIQWHDLVNLIRTNKTLKENTEKARTCFNENNKKLYSILKAQCGAFTPATYCINGHSSNNIANLTTYSMVDLDNVDSTKIPQPFKNSL